jgi:hypothetical protein
MQSSYWNICCAGRAAQHSIAQCTSHAVNLRLTERFLSARAHCVPSSSSSATSLSLFMSFIIRPSAASAEPPTIGSSPWQRTISNSLLSVTRTNWMWF